MLFPILEFAPLTGPPLPSSDEIRLIFCLSPNNDTGFLVSGQTLINVIRLDYEGDIIEIMSRQAHTQKFFAPHLFQILKRKRNFFLV